MAALFTCYDSSWWFSYNIRIHHRWLTLIKIFWKNSCCWRLKYHFFLVVVIWLLGQLMIAYVIYWDIIALFFPHVALYYFIVNKGQINRSRWTQQSYRWINLISLRWFNRSFRVLELLPFHRIVPSISFISNIVNVFVLLVKSFVHLSMLSNVAMKYCCYTQTYGKWARVIINRLLYQQQQHIPDLVQKHQLDWPDLFFPIVPRRRSGYETSPVPVVHSSDCR